MLIAYLTTDEVNQYLAMQMAEECGQTLCLLSLSHASPDGEFDGAVYDWDHLPTERQQAIMAEMLTRRVPHPVAVHSYNLDDDCVEALRSKAVAVYGTLQPEVFRLLARAAIHHRATDTSGCDQEKNQDSEELAPWIG
jgi:hypothetical protein